MVLAMVGCSTYEAAYDHETGMLWIGLGEKF